MKATGGNWRSIRLFCHLAWHMLRVSLVDAITSLEIDPKLIEIAQQNVEEAGLVDMLERH